MNRYEQIKQMSMEEMAAQAHRRRKAGSGMGV